MTANYYIACMNDARIGPHVTCPASRHVAMMAEALADQGQYLMLADEPEYCAESLASVVASLWEARAELAKLKGQAK